VVVESRDAVNAAVVVVVVLVVVVVVVMGRDPPPDPVLALEKSNMTYAVTRLILELAAMETWLIPAVVLVPEITPVTGSSDKPPGKVDEFDSEYETVPTPVDGVDTGEMVTAVPTAARTELTGEASAF
jgi:hypothetical protein